MSVIISVRKGNISDTAKEYAEAKANTMISDYPKITRLEIILGGEKYRYKAEVIVRGKNLDVEADEETYDLYDSIDGAVKKAGNQLVRFFDKVHDHHKAARASMPEINEEESYDESAYEDIEMMEKEPST